MVTPIFNVRNSNLIVINIIIIFKWALHIGKCATLIVDHLTMVHGWSIGPSMGDVDHISGCTCMRLFFFFNGVWVGVVSFSIKIWLIGESLLFVSDRNA